MSKQQELQKINGRKQKNIGDYWHAYYSVFQIVVLNFELTPIFLLFVCYSPTQPTVQKWYF